MDTKRWMQPAKRHSRTGKYARKQERGVVVAAKETPPAPKENRQLQQNAPAGGVRMERAKGFEPSTTCLGSRSSTTELRPLGFFFSVLPFHHAGWFSLVKPWRPWIPVVGALSMAAPGFRASHRRGQHLTRWSGHLQLAAIELPCYFRVRLPHIFAPASGGAGAVAAGTRKGQRFGRCPLILPC